MTEIKLSKSDYPQATILSIITIKGRRYRIVREGGLFNNKWVAVCLDEEPEPAQITTSDSSSDFLTSAIVAKATGSSLLGEMAGGDIGGAILGASLADSIPCTPEVYSTPDPTPTIDTTPIQLESPDPSPSYDSSPSFDSSPSMDSSPCPDAPSIDTSGLV